MDDRIKETINNLKALPLNGGSHENLNAICSVLYKPEFGWTHGACSTLRDGLVGMLEQLDPDEWSKEYLAEVGLVRLPKDADGEYIHIGDRMEDNERVARIVLTDDSLEPSVYLEKLPSVLHEHFCHEVHHYHKPTVEELLDEMYSALDDSRIPNGSESRSYDEIISEYADRIRELIGND